MGTALVIFEYADGLAPSWTMKKESGDCKVCQVYFAIDDLTHWPLENVMI